MRPRSTPVALRHQLWQRRTTRPRDLAQGEERLVVRWHKRQWSCREAPWPRKAFTGQIPELPAGARVTGRLRRHVAGRVVDGLAVSVAGGGLISWPISHAAWVQHADGALGDADPAPVTVLGIDETRRGRPRWVQDELTGRWRLTERFGATSRTCCTASTTGAPARACPSSSASPARSRRGGPRSWAFCRPRPAYGAPASGDHAGSPPAEGADPLKFEEPLRGRQLRDLDVRSAGEQSRASRIHDRSECWAAGLAC